jgi:glycosyltransferase involved in cell wall biosynthesis
LTATATRSTSPRALVFAPFSPYPSQTGAHVHCMMVLEMVRRMGFEPVFVSSPHLTDAPWNSERISMLARDYRAIVELHQASVVDPIWSGLQTLLHPSFSDLAWVTPSLALWFEELVEKYRPGLVVINYAKWGRLADCGALRGIPRILQTHDLLSVNKAFQDALDPFFRARPIDLEAVSGEVLRESFFDAIDDARIPGLTEEISVMKRFDMNLIISAQEVDRIHLHDPAIATHNIPMVFEARTAQNTYSEPPVFLAHTNNFNFQGTAYFVQKILPLIRQRDPSFVLRIAGNICKAVQPVDGLELLGFVDDLDGLYAHARYSICPLLGGTGQQVKVMEAMSFGLPVVAVPRIAKATGIIHGVNGLVAADAPAFAEACLRLWQDPPYAMQLGAKAREHIQEHYAFDTAFDGFEAAVRKLQADLSLEPQP